MSTNIYLVRHAESVYRADDNDFDRDLSPKGRQDAKKLAKLFEEIAITKVLSSPYFRAIETVQQIAASNNLDVELINDFRERKVADKHIEDFKTFSQKQWEDFDYCLQGGESLNQVQTRGVKALH